MFRRQVGGPIQKRLHIRVTKSGPSCPQVVVRPRALPPSPPLFSPLWAFMLLAAGLAGATLALRQKFARLRGANPGAKQAQSDGRRRVGHIVIERCRKQRALPAIQPFDKALHQMPRKSSENLIARITANRAFSHTLGPKLPVDLLGANVGFRRKTRLWQEPL